MAVLLTRTTRRDGRAPRAPSLSAYRRLERLMAGFPGTEETLRQAAEMLRQVRASVSTLRTQIAHARHAIADSLTVTRSAGARIDASITAATPARRPGTSAEDR